MKKYNILLIISGIAAMVLFSGCGGKKPKPYIPDNPLPITSDIQSFKDYILKKRANKTTLDNIIAEKPHQTIIEYRTYEVLNLQIARDIMVALDDTREYCQAIGGNGIYGDQAIKKFEDLPNSSSTEYVNKYTYYQNEMTRQGLGRYSGFYKCASAKDGFEIEYMKDKIDLQQEYILGDNTLIYSRYYFITHDNPQKLNTKFWFKNDEYERRVGYKDAAEKAFREEDEWEYEKGTGAQKYCSYHGGKLYIANVLSEYKKMDIEDYYFERLEQIKDKTNNKIFTNMDYFWCENPNNKAQEFTLVHNDTTLDFKKGVNKGYLKAKGVSLNQTKKLSKKTVEDKDVKNKSSLKVESELAKYTLSTTDERIRKIGPIIYETSYNGVRPDGCEYASVIMKIYQQVADIHNFKQCSGKKMVYIGTSVEELTDKEKEQIKSVGRSLRASCKLQNQATANINEFTVKCFKDPYKDYYKHIVLKNGKLITRYVGSSSYFPFYYKVSP